MASSELEVEPDLNKAPPHVEGELLKQNTKAIVGKKGWKKYYFIVLRDKLQYFRKRDDHKSSREPIGYIRMSQVLEITEVVFDGVPQKKHLNCGFSIVSFHPITQQKQTINLLAETPESMRYWVHALRYIKAYWSKLEVRDTVLSEEQERRLLERILSEEEDDRDVLVGAYTLNDDGSVALTSSEQEHNKAVPVVVYFADGTKMSVKISPSDTTSDLLEKVKDKLSSSAAQLWLVDSNGMDAVMDLRDNPVLHLSNAHRFYVLDPTHRVLVIFFKNMKEFESYVFPATVSTREVLEDREVSVSLDLRGITNTGLFLKSEEEEHIFGRVECPCEVLFHVDASGKVVREPVGHLLIKNQSLGFTVRVAHRSTTKYGHIRRRPGSSFRRTEENRILEEQEEDAQRKALDLLLQRKSPVPKPLKKLHDEIGDDWVITEEESPQGFNPGHRYSAPDIRSGDGRGFEETIFVEGEQAQKLIRHSTERTGDRRTRSSAISQDSPLAHRRRVSTGVSVLNESTERTRKLSPSSPPQQRSRSRSPRRLPEVPSPSPGSTSPSASWKRRNAKRGSKGEVRPRASLSQPSGGKGPTIVILSEGSSDTQPEGGQGSPTGVRSQPWGPTGVRRPAAGSVVAGMMGDITVDSSRSSTFGVKSPVKSLTPETVFRSASPRQENEDKRLEELFSQSYQREQEVQQVKNYRPADTLTAKLQAVSKEPEKERSSAAGQVPPLDDADIPPPRPILIDFTRLAVHSPSPLLQQSSTTPHPQPLPPIEIHSPSLLKVVLLQASEASSIASESRPMDFISLSGVCLHNDHGLWRIQSGCNFHDPLPLDSDDHTETFPLPGGIRAVYNHTQKRWHVLPSPSAPPSISGSRSDLDEGSVQSPAESVDIGPQVDAQKREAQLYLQKKALVTEVGVAFQGILAQFGRTRDAEEKKRIGSDMVNAEIGHVIRGRFCSAIAGVLVDGLKPYRMEGLVGVDLWKVAMAFCQEAQANHTSPLIFLSFDKQILQPINSLKSLQDRNVKFRTFVCLALSKGTLTNWLESLLKQKETLRKFYLPNSFLSLATSSQPYQRLYQELLLTLEPLTYLPFDLSIDFEVKQSSLLTPPSTTDSRLSPVSSPIRGRSPISSPIPSGERSPRLSPGRVTATPSEEAPVSPRERPSVVIKTHAATGQRTGNVISAVWQPPVVEAQGQVGGGASTSEQTDSLGPSVQALKNIQGRVSTHEQQATPTATPTSSITSGGGWFKKLATSLQQINAGGAITGPPKSNQQQQQKPPPPSTDSSERVQALYNNIAEDADELSFSKGEILLVKEHINEEWLICSRGNQSGIVPVNYVKAIV